MPHELLWFGFAYNALTNAFRYCCSFCWLIFFCVRIHLGFPLRFIYSVIAQFLNIGSFLKIFNIFNCFLIRFSLMQPNHYKDRQKKIFSSFFWIGCLFIFISYARYLSLSTFFLLFYASMRDLAMYFLHPGRVCEMIIRSEANNRIILDRINRQHYLIIPIFRL